MAHMTKRLSSLCALLMCAAPLATPQTKLHPNQIQCTIVLSPPAIVCFQIDPATLILDTTTSPPTLRVKPTPVPTAPNFADNETPGGIVNGANLVFTLANTPLPGTLSLYVNGLLQTTKAFGGRLPDYSITGNTITFNAVATPQTGAAILASYRF